MLEAKETVFTCTFRKKVDPIEIENALIEMKQHLGFQKIPSI